jgi:hypothetical protein
MSEFHTRGAVPVESAAYVSRAFEEKLFTTLSKTNWVLLLGPRQHGKSSSLVRLRQRIEDEGMVCARLDLQQLGMQDSYASVLRNVCQKIARQCGTVIKEDPPETEDLESWLDVTLPLEGRIVLLVDEAAAIRQEFRNTFYGQLRSIANGGSDGIGVAKRLVCLFAGTFIPEKLVEDSNNSPFNVCTWIPTEDLTLDQANDLYHSVTNERNESAVSAVFDYVGGQPYLLQRIFDELTQFSNDERHNEVNNVLTSIKSGGDDGHCANLFKQILAYPTLPPLIAAMVEKGDISDVPADNEVQFLITVGLAKKINGSIRFRNLLYRDIAALSPQFSNSPQASVIGGAARLYAVDVNVFSFILDIPTREIVWDAYNAGVNCYANKDFRLALISFGSALEGILQVWLNSLSPVSLAAAVARAKNTTNYTKADIKSSDEKKIDGWSFVNLIRVTRESIGGRKMVEPNHALREWRNFIHPAVAIKNYYKNDTLEPEARQAHAILDAAIRDIAANMP